MVKRAKCRIYSICQQTSSLITVALLKDLRADVIFLPKSANTIFADVF